MKVARGKWAGLALLLGLALKTACSDEETSAASSVGDGGRTDAGGSSSVVTGGAGRVTNSTAGGGKLAAGAGASGTIGGAAGTSAAAAGGSRTGSSDDYAWVLSTEGWREADSVGPCRPQTAIIGELDFPGTDWTACGQGCRRFKPIAGPAELVMPHWNSGLRVEDGEVLVSLSMGVLVEPRLPLLGLFRLDEDLKPLALMKQPIGSCAPLFLSRQSPYLVSTAVTDGSAVGLQQYIGRIHANENGTITWLDEPLTQGGLEGFDYAGGWGGIWNNKSFAVAVSSGSTELTTLFTAPGNLVAPRSNGRRVWFGVWQGDGGAVWSWGSGETEPKTSVEGNWDVADVATSETQVVWLGVTGSRTWDGVYESAAIHWANLDGTNYDASRAISLPITRGGHQLATDGHWAALRGCEDDVCYIYLVDLNEAGVWRLRGDVDHDWFSFGLAEDRILLSEADIGTPGGSFNRLIEFQLEGFQAAAEKL